jgi:streptogramin lyase
MMIRSPVTALAATLIFALTLGGCGGGSGMSPVTPGSSIRHKSALSTPSVTNEYAVPFPNSFPLEITKGPDGALWFSQRSGGSLGRITTTGSIREFLLTGPARFAFGVATGSDSNIWATGISVPSTTVQEHSNNQSPNNAVFRMTTNGTTTAFALPMDSFPKQIVGGPDGNLWFVERYGKIGRMTTSGQLTEYNIPTADSGPSGITVGPDGALWFTETFSGLIGRITTSGAISEFPLPNGGGPFGIATGSDGNLWITEFFGDQIARMTTSGVVTEYPLASGSAARGIVAAPDGNLYFAESGTGKIGQVTVSGTITEIPVPTANSGPAGVTVGPDGNVWFTESLANKIGKLSL